MSQIFQYVLIGVLDYYFIQFLYYWFHRFIHLPCSGIFYKLHYIGHHKRDFPIKRLRGETYNINGSNGWFNTGGEIVFLIPIIIISILAWLYCGALEYFLIFESVLVGNVLVGEFLHSSYHLSNTATSNPESITAHRIITRYKWFHNLQVLHDLHHSYKYGNFGFFDMTMDKLFNTYKEDIPNYLVILNKKHENSNPK